MGWIDVNDKMPPQGLEVLLEVSGRFSAPYGLVADHDFYLGAWIVPQGEKKGQWSITDGADDMDYHFINPTVHAWMPLPRHYQKKDDFDQEEDLMEHAMFEDDPDWLYKGDYQYTPRKYNRMIGCKAALGYIGLMLPAFDKRDEVIERVRYEFEKDAPVKPKFHKGVHGKKYDSYSCGHCGNGGKQVVDKFCSNCGFAIDWRRDDEETVEPEGKPSDEAGEGTKTETESKEHQDVQKDDSPDTMGKADMTAVALNGSQFQGGKIRIYALYQHENDDKKRSNFLSKEYGLGGRSMQLTNGESGFVDFSSKGVDVHSFTSDYRVLYKWSAFEKIIKELVDADEYLTPQERDGIDFTAYPKPAYKYPSEVDEDDEETSDTGADEKDGDTSCDEGEDYVQRSIFDSD